MNLMKYNTSHCIIGVGVIKLLYRKNSFKEPTK